MIDRQNAKPAILGPQAMGDARGPTAGQKAGVGMHHPLGPPRGARGIHQKRVVLRRDIVQHACRVRHRAPGKAAHGVGACDGEYLGGAVVHEGSARAAVIQRIGNCLAPGGKVDHRRTEPAIKRAVKRDDPCAPVGVQDGNAFAFGMARHRQLCGNMRRLGAQLGPAQRRAVLGKDEGNAILARAMIKPIAHRALWRGFLVQHHCPATSQ